MTSYRQNYSVDYIRGSHLLIHKIKAAQTCDPCCNDYTSITNKPFNRALSAFIVFLLDYDCCFFPFLFYEVKGFLSDFVSNSFLQLAHHEL